MPDTTKVWHDKHLAIYDYVFFSKCHPSILYQVRGVKIGVMAFNGPGNSVQLIAMRQKDYEARLHDLESQNIEYADQLAKRDSKIHGLNMRIKELEVQLHHQKGSRAALKQLYHSIDNKIMRTLTERGQRKKEHTSSHPRIDVGENTNYRALIEAARLYDVEEFFALKKRVYKHHLRPSYRVVAKSYRLVRDGGIAGVKKINKLRSS